MSLTLPATVALCAIPYTIMRVLFERRLHRRRHRRTPTR